MGLSLPVSRDWHQTELRLPNIPPNKISYISYLQEFKPCLALEPYRTAQVEEQMCSIQCKGAPGGAGTHQLPGQPLAWGCYPERSSQVWAVHPWCTFRRWVLPYPMVTLGGGQPILPPACRWGTSSAPGHSLPRLHFESTLERSISTPIPTHFITVLVCAKYQTDIEI